MGKLILQTERLTIRELSLEDLYTVHEVLRDSWDDEAETLADREAWLRWTVMSYRQFARLYQPPYGERAITLTATGEMIGLVGIVPTGLPYGAVRHYVPDGYREDDLRVVPEFGLYWCITHAHRLQGYAAEAGRGVIDYLFKEIGVRRVVATTEYDNEGSIGVMRKLGMSIEKNPFSEPFWFKVVGILDYDPARPITTQISYEPINEPVHELEHEGTQP